ncbi:DDE transposase [Arcobacter sp. CECT 8989]|uniref:IS1595 family transposase n=1 Tax=Arcobacter sp. CECT 8989 TaxID=2044509 RepID=UPI00100AC57B|nr:IS1595 family transposase [Arcobacter sp. CECT 8989]RXJ98460.1 DDE transposase [Arcobacter sp. CECT 8989]
MAQHFLLSSKARELSMIKILMMSDMEAFELFKNVRWNATNGEPVCPCCGSVKKHYFLKTRMQFRCKECFHTFSVTSGTIFASHKKPLKIYLLAIALFTNAVKSISALQLSRDLDVQYKTAWVLSHKIRESLMDYNEDEKFEGTCEMDGVYVGHYIRPKNQIDKRVDRRKVHKPNKRVVISLRQRAELSDETVGAIKTKTFILKSENSNEIKEIAHKYIKVGSSIHADESNAYDDLTAHYDMNRVNHQVEYSGVYGENNNQSESFNTRFRRMQYGNLHKIGNLYLSNYANEIAYREDTRRKSNKEIFDDILEKCLSSLVSNEFCGYWQGISWLINE